MRFCRNDFKATTDLILARLIISSPEDQLMQKTHLDGYFMRKIKK